MRFKLLISFFSIFIITPWSTVHSADVENGKQLFKACTLCHGKYAQGIQGGLYPRLAGLPEYYTLHQIELFVNEERFNPAMTSVGRLGVMSDKEKEDLAAYIASIDLNELKVPIDIPVYSGNAENGKELYKDDCKTCHGKKAEGKPKKDAPPTAGQYSEYLQRQIDFFMNKDRLHDNDEEDETFDDYSKEELIDILTYISTLDDQ